MLMNTVLVNKILKLLSCTTLLACKMRQKGYCCIYRLSKLLYVHYFLTERWAITSRSWYVMHSSHTLTCIWTHFKKIVHSFYHLLIMACHFTEKKHQHDPDDDFGMGPSTMRTTFTEVWTTILPCSCKQKQLLHIFPPTPVLGSTGRKAEGIQ